MTRALIAVAGLALFGCKTQSGGSEVREATAPLPAALLLKETRDALREAGCNGCHSDLTDDGVRTWARATRDTYEKVAGTESAPLASDVGGMYRAYPEALRARFASDGAFAAFASAVRRDPQMAVRGKDAGETQQKFEALLDAALRLAAQP